MRPKRRPAAPELRAELAADADRLAGMYAADGAADFAPVAAGYRKRVREIQSGAEVHTVGWALPGWARGGFGMYESLILDEDNVLRHDPSIPSY